MSAKTDTNINPQCLEKIFSVRKFSVIMMQNETCNIFLFLNDSLKRKSKLPKKADKHRIPPVKRKKR